MVRSLLVRGMLAGLLAGVVGFGVARLVGEPLVETAVDLESHLLADHAEAGDGTISRSIQGSAGLGLGALIYGIALGGIFALVFALALGRLGPLTARGTAAVLGLLGFVSISLVPTLKYPSNPPAIGDAGTIERRTGLSLLMILFSVAAVAAAVVVRRRLAVRWGQWDATLLVGGGYVVAMVLCFVLLPGVNEVPQQAIPGVVPAVTDLDLTFPPTLLWQFRLASLGVQAVIWTTIAVSFGALAQRHLDAARGLERERATTLS